MAETMSLLSANTRKRLLAWGVAAAFGAIAGQAYTLLTRPDLPPTVAATLPGARVGFLIAGASAAFELFAMRSAMGLRLRRWPFLASLVARAAIHTAIIVCALLLNRWITTGLVASSETETGDILQDIIHSFVIVALVLFALQAHSLIGGRTLLNVVLGRYYRPVQEQRLFLLLDLTGSTAFSQEVGNETFHRYLSSFFFDIDQPIVDSGGEVHSYIGDAMIATWPLGDRKQNLAAVTAVFVARRRIAERQAWYRKEFGAVPRFRAVLHAGPIVMGECGDSHRQITYLGETLNTTARLEALSKALDVDVLASKLVVDCLELPDEMIATPLGSHLLKGLKTPVAVYSLSLRGDRSTIDLDQSMAKGLG